MRQTFIRSIVRVVARDGLERATTKAISVEADLNEAYIYRCFRGKEDLLAKALNMEDVNLARLLQELLPQIDRPEVSFKQGALELWKQVWAFILEEPDDCVFYIRYYYSASFYAEAYRMHLECYQPFIDQMSRYFKPGTNMRMLAHQLFSTMLFFAYRVMTGEMEDNEQTTLWTFEQIYSFIALNVQPEYLQEEKEM